MTKLPIIALLFAFGTTAYAAKDTNPANYPLQAHVVSKLGVHTSKFNQWTTEIKIGDVLYTSSGVGLTDDCKQAKTSGDYPAKIVKERIELLIEDKVCKYDINGTRDAK